MKENGPGVRVQVGVFDGSGVSVGMDVGVLVGTGVKVEVGCCVTVGTCVSVTFRRGNASGLDSDCGGDAFIAGGPQAASNNEQAINKSIAIASRSKLSPPLLWFIYLALEG